MIRDPVVAGRFYPREATALQDELRALTDQRVPKKEAIGVVSPHAGYAYSGPVAGATFSRIVFKDTFVVMGPSHTGRGALFSIMSRGSWQTPLGRVKIDSDLADQIRRNSNHLEEDVGAQLYEHSIEVQVPFLQYFKADVMIVPIVLGQAAAEVYKEIGGGIARAVKQVGRRAVIVASSDMTHYEPHESARRKDTRAIEAILDLDEDRLGELVEELDITMCGYAPVVSLISAAKELGAGVAELVRYQTSGDSLGDYRSVVGYAGIVIWAA